jgi:type II secretory pathway pseudopilin PulG
VKNLSSLKQTKSAGFSLLELIIVLCILLVTSGAIFRVVNLTMARSATEQTKLDMFQEGREFMDQMTRDLRQAGYPNARNYAPSILATPPANDSRVAVGIVKIAANELWFEADVDGAGTVSVIHYYLDTSTANNCPCLRRSQLPKINGDPYSAQTTPVYQTEVQGVTNTNIFSAYNSAVLQTLPVNFNSNGDAVAGLDTLQAMLSLQALNVDPQTRTKPRTTLVTTVRLNNCSLAASGQQSSCF